MKQIQFEKAFGPVPESVHDKFEGAIANMERAKKPVAKRPVLAWAAAMAAVALLVGVVAMQKPFNAYEEQTSHLTQPVEPVEMTDEAAYVTIWTAKNKGRRLEVNYRLNNPETGMPILLQTVQVDIAGQRAAVENDGMQMSWVPNFTINGDISREEIGNYYTDKHIEQSGKITLTVSVMRPDKPPVLLGQEQEGFERMGIEGAELEELLKIRDKINKEHPEDQTEAWVANGHLVVDSMGNILYQEGWPAFHEIPGYTTEIDSITISCPIE